MSTQLYGQRAVVDGVECGRWELVGRSLLVERPTELVGRSVIVDLFFLTVGRQGIVGASGEPFGGRRVTLSTIPTTLVSE